MTRGPRAWIYWMEFRGRGIHLSEEEDALSVPKGRREE